VVNYILMALTIMVMLGFGTSANITNAYGLLVCTVMVITTVLYSVVIHLVWKKHIAILIGFLLLFLPVDLAFWASNLAKIPTGGWVPLVLAICISSVMIVWTYGTWQVDKSRSDHTSFPKGQLPNLVEDIKALDVTRSRGLTVFLSHRTDMVPNVFLQYLSHVRNLSDRVCFVHIVISHANVVPLQDQLKLTEHSPGFCTLDVTLGYTQSSPDLSELLNRAGLVLEGQHVDPSTAVQTAAMSPEDSMIKIGDGNEKDPIDEGEEVEIHYQKARGEFQRYWRVRLRTVCVLSERIVLRPERKWSRFALEAFRVLHSVTNNPIDTIIVDPDELVEVGKVMLI